MLSVFVLDSTAASRNEIINRINSFLKSDFRDHLLIPRFSLKPVTRQELKFNAAPDICIVGSEIISAEMTELAAIKKLLPDSSLLVRINRSLESLSAIEQLARMGADDVISENCDAGEFFRKLILLARKRAKSRSGKLVVVDSAKGGLGVTSVVAALGECLVSRARKTALIDLDFDSQDLSRFLQVRPFVNENLQLIFDQNRPITEESVSQSLFRVWDDEPGLLCMPPVAENEALYDSRSVYPKTLLSVLETLDHMFDAVIVDAGNSRGAFLRTLYRVADKVLFVVGNDPASLYSSVEKISKVRSNMSPGAELIVLENAPLKGALSSRLLREEISRTTGLKPENWFSAPLASCVNSGRWPGSGNTLYSCGNRQIGRTLGELAERLELTAGASPESPALFSGSLLKSITNRLLPSAPRTAAAAAPAAAGTLPASGSREEPGPLPALPEPRAASAGAAEQAAAKNLLSVEKSVSSRKESFSEELITAPAPQDDDLISVAKIL